MRKGKPPKVTAREWLYMEGGNPPVHAGIFDENGDRLAWWPAGFAPTTTRLDAAYLLIIARETDEEAVGRDVLLARFKEMETEEHASA